MKRKIKIGIIGVGNIGNVHANAFRATSDAEVTAVCDVQAGRVKETADRLNISQRFTDYRELIKSDVDAVVVAVGNTLHRPVALAALKAGKHVLLEKPMAMNAREAQQILDAAKRARRVLQVGMHWRQNPTAKVIREYIANGDFGGIYHIRAVMTRRRGIPGLGGWFTTKALSGGGPMIDLGVHWLDLSMWLSGLWKPTSISAQTYAKFGPRMGDYRYVGMWAGPPKLDGKFDVEDYAAGFVRFGKKATLSFDISWAGNAQDEHFIEILGDKAGVRMASDKPLQILTEQGTRPADILPQFESRGNAPDQQACAFALACLGKARPACTGEEGVVVMKVIDAAYQSSRLNREVAIRV